MSAMRTFRLIFVMLLLAASLPARAVSSSADAPHVRVQLVFPDRFLRPGVSNGGGLYFKLEPGWHVYWTNPGDAGEPPHIQWTLPTGVTAGPLQFPAPKRLPLGPLMDYGYENEVLFPLQLRVADGVKPGPVTLHAKVDWLVCREACIPGKAELEVQQDVAATNAVTRADFAAYDIWRRLGNLLPQPSPTNFKAVFQPTATGFRLAVETGQREHTAVFFPSDPDILDNPAPQKLTPIPNGLILDLKKDVNLSANPAQLKGVLELSGGRNYEIVALPPGVKAPAQIPESSAPVAAVPTPLSSSAVGPASSSSAPITVPPLSWALLARTSGLAFLGGLLLNLMPCVFPVLFLKGLALVNSGNEERRTLRMHGLVYAAGILVSFWALVGVLLGLRAAGATLGWGFQFQSPVFLALMAGLLFFLGLSLAGQFEIGLTLTSAGGSLAAKQGYTGSFFTGVLAVVVATPCTAPFMGAAVGYALAQSSCGHLCRLHGAGAGAGCALRGAHAATGLDAPAAQARRVDGSAAAGCRRSHLRHCDLAGLGSGAGLWRKRAGRAAGEFPAAGDCRVVPGPLAGAALVHCGCRIDSAGSDCAGGLYIERTCCCFGNLVVARDPTGAVGALVARCCQPLSGRGPSGLCGLHRKLVPELPGERASGVCNGQRCRRRFEQPMSPCSAPTGPATTKPLRKP